MKINISALKTKIEQMNIAQKLIGGFGTICVFILINAVMTVCIHFYSNGLRDLEADEYMPVKTNLEDLMSKLTESRRLAVSWVFVDHQPNTPDKLSLGEIVNNDFNELLNNIKDKTENWETSFTDTLGMVLEKIETFKEMESLVMSNLSTFDAYDDPILQMESEMLVQSGGDIEIAENELQMLCGSLRDVCDGKCADLQANISRSQTLQLVLVILMSLMVLGCALFVGRLLHQSIVAPLKKGVAFAEAIGRGDLTATVDVDQEDEIGQLAKSLQAMMNNLRTTVLTIERNANELVNSGVSLRDSSQKLAKGASNQAASAEEVSTAIEQMVANIDQNTENAVATEKLTSSTVENVNLSSRFSGEAAEAMQTISEKISIISDIAFQTNILALNAAVEAVRAGEQGRGFSVVAAEVRKLAERSKQAANEIISLVGKGLKVTQMAGEKAKALVPDIEKTTILIKEISAASIEQKTGAEQINMAMQNLNVITQENASGSDELTNSSVKLNELANELKLAVGYFKLDENAKNEAMHATARAEMPKRVVEPSKDDVHIESAPKVEPVTPKATESVDDNSEPVVTRQEEPKRSGGVKINLGNVGGSEFDLDNYEKF